MQRLKGRSIVFGALAVLACSSGDPTGNESTPTAITANPDVVLVAQGDSQAVIVSVVDEQGQILQSDPTVSDVGAGISVNLDPNYQAVTTDNPIGRQFRFFVKATDLTSTTFTINALGLTKQIPVTATPTALATQLSDTAPVPGASVTVTATPGLSFAATSAVGVGVLRFQIVSQDATSITFIPPPNVNGPVTVFGVVPDYNQALSFDLPTADTLHTVELTTVAGTFSNPNPGLGQPITFTLPADVRVKPESLAALRVSGNTTAPFGVSISADSGTITLTPPPSSDSTLTLHGVVNRSLPQYSFTLESSTPVVTPRIDSVAVNFNTTTPNLGDAVTITAPAGFTFTAAAGATQTRVLFGTTPAAIQSITANSISFVPIPSGTSAAAVNPQITNVVAAAAPQFLLGLPTTLPVTVPGLTPLRFTDDPEFAPSIAFPAAGTTTTLFDGGTFTGACAACFDGPSRFYKLAVPSAATLTFSVDWYEGQDLGIYVMTDPNDENSLIDAGDSFGTSAESPPGHPESVTIDLAAGNYIVAIPFFARLAPAPAAFGVPPRLIKIQISNP